MEHLWWLLLTYVKGSELGNQNRPKFVQIWNETVKVCQKVRKTNDTGFFVSHCNLMFRQSVSLFRMKRYIVVGSEFCNSEMIVGVVHTIAKYIQLSSGPDPNFILL